MTAALVKAAKALIDSVTFDVSGVDGRGGNGGLTSIETIRKCDELRLAIYREERDEKDDKA
ncbi:hypothetical protein [Mesorhizobium sp. B2-5-11]|uniref:hypothetical protein n=1 Tax=Mesorhizobium sp. B2-5-11 TaxID=2589919 RepID=UPI001125F0D9|nr:hypothetical protein [Mesorhizobium sp. B2-5-11]TPK14150.1 hypothetical protein FJ490_02170 [Mesorhizobium sp. B2-5-11]